MANRGNSFRSTDPGLTRAKAKAAQESPEDDQDDEGHDDREPLFGKDANDAEIDDPTTDDDGKLIGHDPEEDDYGNQDHRSEEQENRRVTGGYRRWSPRSLPLSPAPAPAPGAAGTASDPKDDPTGGEPWRQSWPPYTSRLITSLPPPHRTL